MKFATATLFAIMAASADAFSRVPRTPAPVEEDKGKRRLGSWTASVPPPSGSKTGSKGSKGSASVASPSGSESASTSSSVASPSGSESVSSSSSVASPSGSESVSSSSSVASPSGSESVSTSASTSGSASGKGYIAPPPGSASGKGYIAPPPGSASGKGYIPPSGSVSGKGKGYIPPPQGSASGKGKGYIPSNGCRVIPVYFLKAELEATEVATGLDNTPFYSTETGEQLGFYSDERTEFSPSAECVGTALFSFGAEPNFVDQIAISYSCYGEANVVTGGNGQFGCADGYEIFTPEPEDIDRVSSEIYLCGSLCPYTG